MQMIGFAEFKSHVLRRDEKGLFGIPFKRLLFSGLGGGMVTTVTKMFTPEWSVSLGIVSVFVFLFLTAPRGGIPHWQVLVFHLHWQLRTAATLAPKGMMGSLGQALRLPTGGLDINAESVFHPGDDPAPRTTLTDWVSFARYDAEDTTDALVLSLSPGLDLAAE
jgi:hypothetical protein